MVQEGEERKVLLNGCMRELKRSKEDLVLQLGELRLQLMSAKQKHLVLHESAGRMVQKVMQQCHEDKAEALREMKKALVKEHRKIVRALQNQMLEQKIGESQNLILYGKKGESGDRDVMKESSSNNNEVKEHDLNLQRRNSLLSLENSYLKEEIEKLNASLVQFSHTNEQEYLEQAKTVIVNMQGNVGFESGGDEGGAVSEAGGKEDIRMELKRCRNRILTLEEDLKCKSVSEEEIAQKWVSKVGKLQEQNERIQSRVVELQEERRLAEGECQRVTQEKKKVSMLAEKYRNEAETNEKTIKLIEMETKQLKGEVNRCNQEVKRLTTQLSKEKGKCESMKEDLMTKEKLVHDLKKNLQETKARNVPSPVKSNPQKRTPMGSQNSKKKKEDTKLPIKGETATQNALSPLLSSKKDKNDKSNNAKIAATKKKEQAKESGKSPSLSKESEGKGVAMSTTPSQKQVSEKAKEEGIVVSPETVLAEKDSKLMKDEKHAIEEDGKDKDLLPGIECSPQLDAFLDLTGQGCTIGNTRMLDQHYYDGSELSSENEDFDNDQRLKHLDDIKRTGSGSYLLNDGVHSSAIVDELLGNVVHEHHLLSGSSSFNNVASELDENRHAKQTLSETSSALSSSQTSLKDIKGLSMSEEALSNEFWNMKGALENEQMPIVSPMLFEDSKNPLEAEQEASAASTMPPADVSHTDEEVDGEREETETDMDKEEHKKSSTSLANASEEAEEVEEDIYEESFDSYSESDLSVYQGEAHSTGSSKNNSNIAEENSAISKTNSYTIPEEIRVFEALYEYNPFVDSQNQDPSDELGFEAGDLIIVEGDMDQDGFYSGKMGDMGGLVPSNLISEKLNYRTDKTLRDKVVQLLKEIEDF
eukprot:Nk52_evm68s2657 gene=Nk52_evmTU68s2657